MRFYGANVNMELKYFSNVATLFIYYCITHFANAISEVDFTRNYICT